MDQKLLIQTAKNYVSDLYSDEQITDISLEGIQPHGNGWWDVIVSFRRPTDAPKNVAEQITSYNDDRTYKTVTITPEGVPNGLKIAP